MNYSKKIEDDRSYRNNELSFLKDTIFYYKNKEWEKTLIRSGILLLYAHWEWFCKTNSEIYVKYLKECNLSIEKVSKEILVNNIFNNNKINKSLQIWTIKHIFGKNITTKDLIIKIDTEDNLKYSTIKERILPKIWIDQKKIEEKFRNNLSATDLSKLDFIDKNKIKKYFFITKNTIEEKNFDSYDNFFLNTSKILLHYRNEIWHGKADLSLTIDQFLFIYESIRTLMLSYKDVLVDYIEK